LRKLPIKVPNTPATATAITRSDIAGKANREDPRARGHGALAPGLSGSARLPAWQVPDRKRCHDARTGGADG
jgi:hypothetical protein